ncbi:metallophosphoesterase [Corallococcus silvisoli]|uniref:metallophosphoesterase n=1 Tax=Corallococcus silvisoli TaxID=2697031 RepID=UPI0013772964|nr:metallophosphoesterase [Corallococcus silvisoli]NBD07983.1 metallophosphoesterase [Corallococcus silvisoli]
MPRWLSMALFLVPVTTLLLVANVYLYRRLVRDVSTSVAVRRAGFVLFAGGFIGSLGARLLGARLDTEAARATGLLLLIWMGLVLYLLLFTLVLDVGRRVVTRVRKAPEPPSPARRAFLARGVAAGATVAGAAVSTYGTWRAFHPPEVLDIPVRLPRLPKALEGFTLVQLSDIHIGGVLQRRFVDEMVARVNALKPDLIAVTGDLVDGSVPELGRYVAGFGALKARHGAYFITGNHDYYSGVDAWVAFVQGLGITVLRNRAVSIGDAGASFDLLGVDDWSAWKLGEPGYDLDAAMRGLRPDRASVLLAHQPSNFDEVARRDVGLQISGHTHGGQMFPGNLLGDLVWGEQNAGLSRMGNSHIYVSRGCGFVGPPMRVAAPPEIARIILLPG